MDENGITNRTETRDELLRVHEWRAEQLEQLGFSRLIAEATAAVDWHDVARLVAPRLFARAGPGDRPVSRAMARRHRRGESTD
jgi:hypothetical protein